MATELSALAMLASRQQSSTSAHPGDKEDTFAGSSTAGATTKEQLRRHHVRTLHKVIDQSDVVVLVLDARDPEGCRSRLVEEEVRRRESEGKKLVFVLNKIGSSPCFQQFLQQATRPIHGVKLCRPCPTPQRRSLATISATFDADPTISFCTVKPTRPSAIDIRLSVAPASHKSLQAKRRAKHNGRHRGLPQCWQEQFNQHSQTI
jgi:hypothetical protein